MLIGRVRLLLAIRCSRPRLSLGHLCRLGSGTITPDKLSYAYTPPLLCNTLPIRDAAGNEYGDYGEFFCASFCASCASMSSELIMSWDHTLAKAPAKISRERHLLHRTRRHHEYCADARRLWGRSFSAARTSRGRASASRLPGSERHRLRWRA